MTLPKIDAISWTVKTPRLAYSSFCASLWSGVLCARDGRAARIEPTSTAAVKNDRTFMYPPRSTTPLSSDHTISDRSQRQTVVRLTLMTFNRHTRSRSARAAIGPRDVELRELGHERAARHVQQLRRARLVASALRERGDDPASLDVLELAPQLHGGLIEIRE